MVFQKEGRAIATLLTRGKPIHSDEKNHKTTYVTLMGIEKASQQVKKLSDEAVTLLEGLNKKNEFLFTLVNELVGRRK